MNQFFKIIMEKFFPFLVGTLVLGIIILGMETASNFGVLIDPKTIAIGWVMVAIWIGLISIFSLLFIIKKSENNE